MSQRLFVGVLSVALAATGTTVAAASGAGAQGSHGSTGGSPWRLVATDPFDGSYYPTFTGNGYFAARVPAQGQGYSTADVPTSFQIQGFYASGDDGKQARESGPAWTGLTVSDGSGSFDDAFGAACAFGTVCQAEDADLSGGLSTATDHSGYRGSAFVQGWGTVGSRSVVAVTGTSADDAELLIRYAAGDPGDGTAAARELTVTVGGSAQTVDLPATGGWDDWETVRVPVRSDAGSTQVALGCASGQDCRVNVDDVALVKAGADPVEGATEVGLTERGLSGYRQTLDLRTGAISTRATWTSPAGRKSDVEYTVLPSRADDQLGVVRVTVRPHWTGELAVTDVLDPRAAPEDATFTRSASRVDQQIGLTTTLPGTNQRASVVSELQGRGSLSQDEDVAASGAVQQTLTARVSAGRTYAFTKFVGLATTQDVERASQTTSAAARVAERASDRGYGTARRLSDRAWATLWQGDVQVKGDDELQRQIRASRFYLLASVGERAWSPTPAGLSSGNYGGHVFWDTETWMWPSLVAQDPDLAKAVLQYRVDRLDDARYNARHTMEYDASTQTYRAQSYDGIRFPWEGGLDGKEQTTSLFFGGHEVHITADVALAFWQYYEASGDKAWLKKEGWPVLKGAAEFWVSRSTRGSDGKYHIDDVTPPDEWASNGSVGRDDSAYTNVAAAQVLRLAAQAADVVHETPAPEWAKVADGLVVPTDAERGVTQEYAGYDGRTIKQADAVMLTYPWQHEQSDELTASDLDYYSTKVDENASPSMTDAMHSIVAAGLGRSEEAYWFTQRSSTAFMRGPFEQFTEERGGGHAFTFVTGAGGFLQEFYYGYSGLRWGTDGISLSPVLPTALDEIRLTGMKFQGTTFDLVIGPKRTTVKVTAGPPLKVTGRGTATVSRPLVFSTRASTDADGGYGTLVGSLSTPAGHDDGPGTYQYPSADVFTDGSFDMTSFAVYRDGKNVNLVTTVDGQILNPWALEGMSLQLVHVYIRSGTAGGSGRTPALAGTNVSTSDPWQLVAVANPRHQRGATGTTGVFASDGTRVGDATLTVREQKDIVLTIPASVFDGMDLSKASFVVAMMSAAEDGEGVSNVRPVFDCTAAGVPSWTGEWRFCGGRGVPTDQSPFDSDTSDGNVVKTFVPRGTTQAKVLAPQPGGPVLPFVRLSPGGGGGGSRAAVGSAPGHLRVAARDAGRFVLFDKGETSPRLRLDAHAWGSRRLVVSPPRVYGGARFSLLHILQDVAVVR
ncbi:hypothetical protein GCM10023221_26280 [Luteimicrobium xylanilyticum]|uniref:glucodextranase DOMON-like domain-containing protein n=1 Tax=Luteimicrobium xylanilyticum TaxID=1133546 RepID=UPI0031E73FA4